MFFGGSFGQRLEPVGIVGYSQFGCPAFHACGYFVGDAAVQRSAIVHSICQYGIDIARQVFDQFFTVDYLLGKVFTGPLGRCFY